jgi:hypothetical protein
MVHYGLTTKELRILLDAVTEARRKADPEAKQAYRDIAAKLEIWLSQAKAA